MHITGRPQSAPVLLHCRPTSPKETGSERVGHLSRETQHRGHSPAGTIPFLRWLLCGRDPLGSSFLASNPRPGLWSRLVTYPGCKMQRWRPPHLAGPSLW